jgi:hypothetical protein
MSEQRQRIQLELALPGAREGEARTALRRGTESLIPRHRLPTNRTHAVLPNLDNGSGGALGGCASQTAYEQNTNRAARMNRRTWEPDHLPICLLRLSERAVRDSPPSGKPEVLERFVSVVGEAVVICKFDRDCAEAFTKSLLFARILPIDAPNK